MNLNLTHRDLCIADVLRVLAPPCQAFLNLLIPKGTFPHRLIFHNYFIFHTVFLTFWQGLAIAILAASIGESTPNVGSDDAELWAKQAQNFLICLEMLLFSIAHFYCFPTEEWEEGYRPVVSDAKFGDQLALNDFFQDIKLLARQGKKKNKGKKKPQKDVDAKNADGDPDSDGATAKEVVSDSGLAADDSFDDEDLNLSQVESQLEGNLASPDTPENIRAASLRLLQAMAFETPIVQRNTAISSPRVDGSIEKATSRTAFDSSQTSAGVLPSNSPPSLPTATDEISDVDEGNFRQSQNDKEEQQPDEENNTMVLRYDDEPGEETGLLRSIDRSNEDGDDHVMGGGASSDGNSMLRPSLFTTLGKFS